MIFKKSSNFLYMMSVYMLMNLNVVSKNLNFLLMLMFGMVLNGFLFILFMLLFFFYYCDWLVIVGGVLFSSVYNMEIVFSIDIGSWSNWDW